jgi:2-oxoglutarate ferredoxin oxidoreductase subunit alpha
MGEAIDLARAQGQAISGLTLLSLWPVPKTSLQRAIAQAQRVVVAELNPGLLRREIERFSCKDTEIIGVNRLDGELIMPRQILHAGGLL